MSLLGSLALMLLAALKRQSPYTIADRPSSFLTSARWAVTLASLRAPGKALVERVATVCCCSRSQPMRARTWCIRFRWASTRRCSAGRRFFGSFGYADFVAISDCDRLCTDIAQWSGSLERRHKYSLYRAHATHLPRALRGVHISSKIQHASGADLGKWLTDRSRGSATLPIDACAARSLASCRLRCVPERCTKPWLRRGLPDRTPRPERVGGRRGFTSADYQSGPGWLAAAQHRRLRSVFDSEVRLQKTGPDLLGNPHVGDIETMQLAAERVNHRFVWLVTWSEVEMKPSWYRTPDAYATLCEWCPNAR